MTDGSSQVLELPVGLEIVSVCFAGGLRVDWDWFANGEGVLICEKLLERNEPGTEVIEEVVGRGSVEEEMRLELLVILYKLLV